MIFSAKIVEGDPGAGTREVGGKREKQGWMRGRKAGEE